MARLPAGPAPVVAGLRQFLGGWLGIGRIVVGMARNGCDLQLTRYGEEGWQATFYPAGRGHSVTSAVGSAWERRASVTDLTGRCLVVWLSPEAIETFLGVLAGSQHNGGSRPCPETGGPRLPGFRG